MIVSEEKSRECEKEREGRRTGRTKDGTYSEKNSVAINVLTPRVRSGRKGCTFTLPNTCPLRRSIVPHRGHKNSS